MRMIEKKCYIFICKYEIKILMVRLLHLDQAADPKWLHLHVF